MHIPSDADLTHACTSLPSPASLLHVWSHDKGNAPRNRMCVRIGSEPKRKRRWKERACAPELDASHGCVLGEVVWNPGLGKLVRR